MGTTAEKLTYLNETKTQLKDMLNLGGASLTTEPFRQYVDTLKNRYLYFMNNGTQEVWDNWEKVVGEGTTITLNNTEEAPMKIVLKGNTSQEETPTPETPQPIQVVSGDNSIVVGNGKNIFNMKEYASANSSYFTYSSSTGLTAIAKDNRATANVGYPIEVDTNTTYYIKTDTDKRLLIAQFNSNNVWITNNEVFNGDSFKPNANASYIRVKVADTLTSFPTVVGNVYISTSSDYTGESYPVNLGDIELCKIGTYQDRFFKTSGKNLYNKAISTFDGYVTNDGTEAQSANYKTSDYIPIEPNTTYVTSVMTNPGSNPSRCYYDENKTFISGEKHYGATTMVGTSPNNAKYMRESIPVVDIDKVQIEEGSSATDYEPYGNGDWYLKKEIGKVVLNGSEKLITYGTSTSGYSQMRYNGIISSVLKPSRPSVKVDTFCNRYLSKTSNDTYTKNQGVSISTFGNVDFYDDTYHTSVDDYKTWLSTHNVELYYPLATPTYTEITDSTLLSQLNALAKSYTSQTNISQESNDLASILNATALREMS